MERLILKLNVNIYIHFKFLDIFLDIYIYITKNDFVPMERLITQSFYERR